MFVYIHAHLLRHAVRRRTSARNCPEHGFLIKKKRFNSNKKKKPVIIAGVAKSGIESLWKFVITSRLHLFYLLPVVTLPLIGPRIRVVPPVVCLATSLSVIPSITCSCPLTGCVLPGVIIKDSFRQRVIWRAFLNVQSIASLPNVVSKIFCVLWYNTSNY